MRFSINLASEPYENLRPLRAAVSLLALLAVVLSLTIAWKARHNRAETRELAEQSDRLDRDLVNLRREEHELMQGLFRPEVQTIRERSTFLNSLIERKSLSWSQLFMDLEKVLPDQVQVAAIRPNRSESAEPQLKLTVLSLTVAPLVEFLKNLESSPQFAKPVVDSQRYPGEKEKSATPMISLDLSVAYRQSNAAEPPSGKPKSEPVATQPEKETAGKSPGPIADARAESAGKGER